MYVTQLLTGLKDIFCTCEVHNVFLYIALKFIPIYSRLNEAPGPSTSRVSDSISDIVKAAIENSDVGLKKKRNEFEKSWNSEKEPEPEIVDVPTDNVWQPKPISDIELEYRNFKEAIGESDEGLEKKRVEFEKSWNSGPEIVDIPTSNVLPKQPAGSDVFLPSSSSTSGRKDSLPGKVPSKGGFKSEDTGEFLHCQNRYCKLLS